MDYKTADLSQDAVEQLQRFELELSNETGEEIVLIAYKKPRDIDEAQRENLIR